MLPRVKEETVVVSDIGSWEKFYDVTNQESIALANAIPNTTIFIGAGYHEAKSEAMLEDQAVADKNGFVINPIYAKKGGQILYILTWIGTRPLKNRQIAGKLSIFGRSRYFLFIPLLGILIVAAIAALFLFSHLMQINILFLLPLAGMVAGAGGQANSEVIRFKHTKRIDDILRKVELLRQENARYIEWREGEEMKGVKLPAYWHISTARTTSHGVWKLSDEKAYFLLDIAGVQEGSRVFDFGCGNGRLDAGIAYIFKAEVRGYETDPDLAFEAQLYASWVTANLKLNVAFEQGDFTDKTKTEKIFQNDILYYAFIGTLDYEALEEMVLNNLIRYGYCFTRTYHFTKITLKFFIFT